MKTFGGELLFLDRSDINTDEIIPAHYLAEVDKAALKPHLLEDLDLPASIPTADHLAGLSHGRQERGPAVCRPVATVPWADHRVSAAEVHRGAQAAPVADHRQTLADVHCSTVP